MESQGSSSSSSSSSVMILPAALALGLGLGVGMSTTLHKWTHYTSSPPLSPSSSSSSLASPSSFCSKDEIYQVLQVQLYLQVLDSRSHGVTFDKFPYYLNEQTKVLLTNAACVHLKQLKYSKFIRNLSPASRTILLSGPLGTETYHQMLAKGLAHLFGAKLLILDITDLARKVLVKCGSPRESTDSYSMLTKNLAERLVGLFGSRDAASSDLKFSTNASYLKKEGKTDATTLKRQKSWPFDDKLLVVAIYRVLRKISEASPIILYLRDVEKLILRGSNTFSLFQKMINKLSGPIFVLGSRVMEESFNDQVSSMLNEKVAILFPYNIDTKAPEDTVSLVSWKSQLEEDMKAIRGQDNKNHVSEVLAANDVECDDLDSISFPDTLLSDGCKYTLLNDGFIEEIVVSAISHHLMHTDKPQHRSGRLVISSKSLLHGLSLFKSGQLDTKVNPESNPATSLKASSDSTKSEVKSSVEVESHADKKPDVVADASLQKGGDNMPDSFVSPSTAVKETVHDNEFEKRIRPAIIPKGEIGVSFRDVGALDEVKDVLQEVVMLPLQRPELFNKGGLIKPCKGVLLFGPPGTGKTMLAKAVATEAGASFINVSMSTITSKWFGEDEKTVKALFTLAAKVAPTIIFIDEVDSMLGQRSRNGEHEAMRKIKNELMAHWDGLLSNSGQRVLVLAATNRPFDLDDAIIRRFERRIMVGLPDKNNRERILRAILEKETVSDDLDYDELSTMTEGYSGSDLKNLCTVAAYRPLKELLSKEKQKNEKRTDQSKMKVGGQESESVLGERPSICNGETMVEEKDGEREKENGGGIVLRLRPLNMEDMKKAKSQVSSSFAAEGTGMNELKSWNELFGEGGSRRKEQLTYFL